LLSSLQKAQHEIQLDWLRKGEVPQVESIVLSMVIIQGEEGKSYFTILMGVQVRHSPHSVFEYPSQTFYLNIHLAEDLWYVYLGLG
jgi:hypothetical protein